MASSSSHHLHLLTLFLLAAILLPFISCGDYDFTLNQCIHIADKNQSSPTMAEKMLSDLVTLAPENNFAYSYHNDSGLYGLAWCRGSKSDSKYFCSRCLGNAASKLIELCSNEIDVARIVITDFCYLRLDTEDFITSLDVKFTRILYDSKYELKHWDPVHKVLGDLKEAIPQKKRWFVEMKVDFEVHNSTIYGFGQCVKGISGKSCKACLDQAMKRMEDLCMYNWLCEIWYGSCFLEYFSLPYGF